MELFLVVVILLLWAASIALLPFATDTPLEHWPFATVGVMVLNMIIYGLVDFETSMMLVGDGIINPVQWLTSIYTHFDAMHLFGNMLFLWVFGMVVEGKVGWAKFLGIYHFVGLAESAIAQLVCIGFSEAVPTAGASGAIMGLLAIAMVWAPCSNVFCPYSMIFGSEVELMYLAFFYLANDFMTIWLQQFHMSGAMLHWIGALIGAVIGVKLFRLGMVNCDGYDIFAVLRGKEGDASHQPEKWVSEKEKEKAEHERQLKTMKNEATLKLDNEKLAGYFAAGHLDMAYSKFKAMRSQEKSIDLTQDNLEQLVRHMMRKQEWDGSISLIREFVRRFESDSVPMKLKLARIFLVAKLQPRRALKVLDTINQGMLDDQSKSEFHKIVLAANQSIQQGDVEVREN